MADKFNKDNESRFTDSGYFSQAGTEECTEASNSALINTPTSNVVRPKPSSEEATNLSADPETIKEGESEDETNSPLAANCTVPLLETNENSVTSHAPQIPFNHANYRSINQSSQVLTTIPEEAECEVGMSLSNMHHSKTVRCRIVKHTKLWEQIKDDIDDVDEEPSSTCCVECCKIHADCFREELLSVCLCKHCNCENADMSGRLVEAQKKGWIIFQKIIFPLVHDIIRDIWVIIELLCVLLSFSLSLYSICHGKREVFNNIHFAFIVVATALAIIDTSFSLASSRSFRNLIALCKNEGTRIEHGCIPHSKKLEYVDVARSIVSELLFYPLLLCDIIEFVTGRVYRFETVEDRVSFFLFLLSGLEIVVLVYITRLLLLAGIIYNVHEHRKPLTEGGKLSSYSKNALYFQLFFFIHVIGQMIAQIMTFISIGANIYYYNEAEGEFHLSSNLWYMVLSGYILPVCGFFSFFMVTSYWVREFPIGVYIDVMEVALKPEIDDLMYINERVNQRKLDQGRDVSRVKEDLSNVNWCTKFIYPFYGPIIILLCGLYSIFQLAFLICGATVQFPDGWRVFYDIFVSINVIANVYVYLVAYVWFAIIALVIEVGLTVIYLILLLSPCSLLVVLWCILNYRDTFNCYHQCYLCCCCQ